jgi:ABC-type multidrug transport system fused ATPase/permease subunit
LVAQKVLSRLGTGQGVAGPIVLLAALLIAGAVLAGFNAWLQQRTSERVVRQVRRELVFRLIRLRVPELDRRLPGDVIARVTPDSTLLKSAATEGLINSVNGLLTFIGAIVLMGTLHLGLLAITMVVLIVVAVVMTIVLPRTRAAVARAQESGRRVSDDACSRSTISRSGPAIAHIRTSSAPKPATQCRTTRSCKHPQAR